MRFVIVALVLIAVFALVIWSLFLRKSVEADVEDATEKARDAADRERRAEEEALLNKKGEPLRCLNCGARFLGPMPDDGCPQCHLATLVVSERVHGTAAVGESPTQTLGKDT